MSGFQRQGGGGRGLEDYVDVATRIQRFYEKYPEGSLQSDIIVDDGERIVVRAWAWRHSDDKHPGQGHAEEVRGQGMVNRTSALENAETSAWGRALAALGFEVKKGVASRNEVEAARARDADNRVVAPRKPADPPTTTDAAYIAEWKQLARAERDALTRHFGEVFGAGTPVTWSLVQQKWPGIRLARILEVSGRRQGELESVGEAAKQLRPKPKPAA